ncbi:MAG TPA: TonB-dependent receptor [Sphingobacteriaceae bacterium]|nr:TonB-dependent receptor [Sphingobacteriaceae bacterium]
MRFSFALLLLLSFKITTILAQPKHTISGYVREKGSAELLIGVNVYELGTNIGTVTNTYGFFSLTLPTTDSVNLVFTYVGYSPEIRRIKLDKNVEVNIELQPGNTLDEVQITTTQKEKISEAVQMSNIQIPISQIKDIPALLGEKDVMKVLQLMPGVQKGSEGNSGIYVRGGGPDQNLIMLDDAVVYNASHLFGFFSLFNGDALKSVEMTKGGFPARYGGRLSSVIELNMKDGNKEEVHGEGGIGLIASRLMVEGPLKKNVSSFLISGRRTYVDLLARPFMPSDEKGGYYFYDLNTKINYDFGRKNKLYLSGYFGQDRFSVKSKEGNGDFYETGINWGNATGTVRWNHLFNNQLFSNTSLIYSNYQFNIFSLEKYDNDKYKLDYLSGIRDIGFKYDLDYFPDPRHTVRTGLLSTYHRFKPSALVVEDPDEDKIIREVDNIDVVETGIYVEDTYRPISNLQINGGFRLTHFAAKNKYYIKPEPRLAISYRLKEDFALKASYASMNQFVHLLSNTGIGLPTDLWVPSNKRVAPQQSEQVAVGIAKDLTKQNLSFTMEGYYKKSDNIIGYKEGASFLLIDDPESSKKVNYEDNITAGQGWSYGMEFLLQRKIGKISGWAGYTLSWTQLQFDELNFGKKYYARYDRRHDISVVGIYKATNRITLSTTWVYGTGNAITMPQSSYSAATHLPHGYTNSSRNYFSGSTIYGDKNSFRMGAYHRLDAGIQFHKQKKWGERTWEISFYNAYSRQNPFYYYLDTDSSSSGSTTRLTQVSLFPIIPSFSYNFKF